MIPWITCREVVDFLERYLSGALGPEVAQFERHLSECPPCVAYMQTYEATVALSRAALTDAGEIPGDIPEDLVQAILRSRPKDGD